MTVNQMLNELMIWGVLLLAGFSLREVCRPLQRLFIPASVIGGLLALIFGQQVLGIIEVPKSFSSYAGVLIRIVMTGLILGVAIDRKKIASYADYMLSIHSLYGWQMALGVALGALLGWFWPGMPQGWGVQGVFSFYGGHGTAGAGGAVFKELGVEGMIDIGMVLSTFGLIVAMAAGMAVVNYGVRKGWATFVKEPQKQPDHFYRGILPLDQQMPIGKQKTTSISINPFALQLSLILLAMFIGDQLFKGLAMLFPAFAKVPSITHGVAGAIILWPLMEKLKFDRYCDKKTINEICGLSLDIVILGAMATLNLKVVTTFLLPLLIFTAIMCGLTILHALFICKKFCAEQWFEKAVFIIGACCGATPTGLALVRAVDPDSQACPAEAHGVYVGITFWTYMLTAILPVTLMTGIGFAVGLGSLQFAVCIILGVLFFARRKHKTTAV